MHTTMLNSRMAGNFDRVNWHMNMVKTAISTRSPVLTHDVLELDTDWYYAYVNS